MRTDKILLILYSFVICVGLNAQSISTTQGALLAHEKHFLDLVTRDTVHDMQLNLPLTEFTFGIPKIGFNGIAFIKHKRKITIQPLGTGRVYEITKGTNSQYEIKRIDSTIHSGVNFNAFTFFLADSLYQLGGTGFWNTRGIFTYFSKKTKQWELEMSNKLLPIFKLEETVVLYKTNEASRKLYISNAVKFMDFPNSLATSIIDSCYEYSFPSREWKTLGALNPNLRKSLTNGIDLNFNSEHFSAFTRELDFYWVNFSTNTYGKFKDAKNSEIKQEWIGFYPANDNVKHFQFSLGDSLYLAKINKNQGFEYRSIALSIADFNLSNTHAIYSNEKFNTTIALRLIKSYGAYGAVLLLLLATYLYASKTKNNKQTTTSEVLGILYNNFYNSLSVIEKELIEVLFEYQQKEATLNTKIINKIIGVQQKDVLTQNKSRSDHFIRINQKFNLATQQVSPLIIKQRDELDKRQFNYTLNLEYIAAIGKLLKSK